MLIGLLISVALAVTFLCLYVCAVQDNAGLNRDNEWLRKQRNDEHYIKPEVKDKKPLDMDGICEAIRYNGYVPIVKSEDFVEFMIQSTRYYVHCGTPVITMSLSYRMNLSNPEPDDLDPVLVKKAAETVEHNVSIGKILFDEEGVTFYASTIAKTFEEFRDNFSTYLDMVHHLLDKHHEEYQALEKAKAEDVDNVTINNLPQYAQKWEA